MKFTKDHAADVALNIENEVLTHGFVKAFTTIADAAHANSIAKGFWDANTDDGNKIALMHSELSEALEALRKPDMEGKLPSHSLLEEELGDVIVRIMDFAASKNLDVGGAVVEKMRYNMTRPEMHGGKKF